MQHKYFGDIGDLGKYGLLKHIASSGYKLGVNWCLYPPENNNDGQYINYFTNARLKECDIDVFEALQKLMSKWKNNPSENERHLKLVKEHNIIGSDFIEYLEEPELTGDKRERLQAYEDWHKTGYEALSNADLIFFDPDNGLEVKSSPKGSFKGPKYVFIDHLKDYFDNGKSLIIYQHRDRSKKCYEKRLQQLRDNFEADISHIIFTKGSQRAYFFVLQDEHLDLKDTIYNDFLRSNWKYCFKKG